MCTSIVRAYTHTHTIVAHTCHSLLLSLSGPCAADKAYREMKSLKQSQSIIVSGMNTYTVHEIILVNDLSLPPPPPPSNQVKVVQERLSPPSSFSGGLLLYM